MIVNLSSVTLVAYFTWLIHVNIVQAAKYSDPYIYYGLGDSTDSERENETRVKRNDSSSGLSSGSKKPLKAISKPTKKQIMDLKYRSHVQPIVLEIDDNTANSLQKIELELESKFKDSFYYWENYEEEVTPDRIEFLCKNIWASLKPRLDFIRDLTDEFIPDCDGALILGPSGPTARVKRYFGHFQYAPDLEGKTFFADTLRCHCAYLERKKRVKKYSTVNLTLFYFYIVKVTKESYCVLTTYGDKKSRNIKIVAAEKIHETADEKSQQ